MVRDQIFAAIQSFIDDITVLIADFLDTVLNDLLPNFLPFDF